MNFASIISVILLISVLQVKDVLSLRQRFVEVPESAEVIQGANVTLRCAVQEQQGRAQWTKDGFALGFERDVPGYPRYVYWGDGTIGQHHLNITGATLKDDGEYQCQVGPATMAAPIWASASLTVLVPPRTVHISSSQGLFLPPGVRGMPPNRHHHPAGSSSGEGNPVSSFGENKVINITAGSSLTLECLVTDARPPPNVSWHRNGQLIDSSLQSDSVISGTERLLSSLHSSLKISVTGQDDGVQYWCKARHLAITNSSAPNLMDIVTFTVLHPPNKPSIWGPPSGTSGQTLIYGCRAGGGNPKAEVSWYLEKEQLTSPSPEEARVHVTLIPKLHKAKLTCKAESPMLNKPLMASKTLSVQYAPESVSVKGPDSVTVGESFGTECVTSPANPPANLSWTVDGRTVFDDNLGRTREVGSGWISSSTLTGVKPSSFDGRHVEVVCTAAHTVQATHASHVVTIIKPPGKPIIRGDVLNQVKEGDTIAVSCRSEGGNPPPIVSLSIGGHNLTTKVLHEGDSTEVVSRLTVAAHHNGEKVVCVVKGSATRTNKAPLTTSAILDVAFSAAKVTGKSTPQEVEEKSSVTLECNVSSSNPPPRVTWWSGGTIYRGAEHTETRGEHRGVTVRSVLVLQVSAKEHKKTFTCKADNGVTVPTTHNITISVRHQPIWILPVTGIHPVQEGETLTLTALASAYPGPLRYTWERGSQFLWSKEYSKAEVKKVNFLQTSYTKTDTDRRSFLLSAIGERDYDFSGPTSSYMVPGVNSFMYGIPITEDQYHDENDIIGPHYDGDMTKTVDLTGQPVGVFTMKDITRENSGKYSVIASSSRGSINSTFTIEVLYPPEEVKAPGRLMVKKSEDVKLDCTANGNPPPTITWTRVQSPNEESFVESTREEALRSSQITVTDSGQLQLLSVNIRNTGSYQCVAENSVGTLTARPTKLIVSQIPTHINSEFHSGGAWANINGSGTLVCKVKASPAPTFTWEKRKVQEAGSAPTGGVTSSSRVTVHPPELIDELIEWSSRLEIRGVGVTDYGDYTCHARNELGHSSDHYTLRPPKPPQTPVNITIIDLTTSSATLSWVSPDYKFKKSSLVGDSAKPKSSTVHYATSYNTHHTSSGDRNVNIEGVFGSEHWQPQKPDDGVKSAPITYIVRYQLSGTTEVMAKRVPHDYPPTVTLDDLAPGRSYSVRVLASSEEGTSSPSSYITVSLPGGYGMKNVVGGTFDGMRMAEERGGVFRVFKRAPRLLLLILVVTGSALLALNVAIVVCFVKRKNRENRHNGSYLKGPTTVGGYLNGDDRPAAGTVGAALLQSADSCPTSLQGDETGVSSIALSNNHSGGASASNTDMRHYPPRSQEESLILGPDGSIIITSEPDLVRPSMQTIGPTDGPPSMCMGEESGNITGEESLNSMNVTSEMMGIPVPDQYANHMQPMQHVDYHQTNGLNGHFNTFTDCHPMNYSSHAVHTLPYASLNPANLCDLEHQQQAQQPLPVQQPEGNYATLNTRIRSRQAPHPNQHGVYRAPPLPKAPPVPPGSMLPQKPDITRDLHKQENNVNHAYSMVPSPLNYDTNQSNDRQTPDITNHTTNTMSSNINAPNEEYANSCIIAQANEHHSQDGSEDTLHSKSSDSSSRRRRTNSERSAVSHLMDDRNHKKTQRGAPTKSDVNTSDTSSRSSSSMSGNNNKKSPRHSITKSSGSISEYLNTDTIKRNGTRANPAEIIFSSSYSPPTIYYTTRPNKSKTPSDKYSRKKSSDNPCANEDIFNKTKRNSHSKNRSRESLNRNNFSSKRTSSKSNIVQSVASES